LGECPISTPNGKEEAKGDKEEGGKEAKDFQTTPIVYFNPPRRVAVRGFVLSCFYYGARN